MALRRPLVIRWGLHGANSVCCVAARSAVVRRTSVLRTVATTLRRAVTAALVSVRRELTTYPLNHFTLYPPKAERKLSLERPIRGPSGRATRQKPTRANVGDPGALFGAISPPPTLGPIVFGSCRGIDVGKSAQPPVVETIPSPSSAADSPCSLIVNSRNPADESSMPTLWWSGVVYCVILQSVNARLSLVTPLSVTLVPESFIVLQFLNDFRYSSPAFVTCVSETSRNPRFLRLVKCSSPASVIFVSARCNWTRLVKP